MGYIFMGAYFLFKNEGLIIMGCIYSKNRQDFLPQNFQRQVFHPGIGKKPCAKKSRFC